MNEQAIMSELKSQLKPYIGIMPQGRFSYTMRMYEVGLLKPNTLRNFLNQFGYFNQDGLWVKK